MLGVALQAAGSRPRPRERRSWRGSSPPPTPSGKRSSRGTVPRGLERVKTDLDVPASLRVEDVIVASEQRDQRELAAFHLERGRRLFQAERDAEAIAELRRTVYPGAIPQRGALLLGRIYLRTGRTPKRSTR